MHMVGLPEIAVPYERLILGVKEAIAIFSSIPGMEKQNSGFFTILERGKAPITCEIGSCPSDEAEMCKLLSLEKAMRLKQSHDHLLSWESRDPNAMVEGQSGNKPWGKWGGAVRLGTSIIISFSGLPEMGDEAAMIYAAYDVCWLNDLAVESLQRINGNEFIKHFPFSPQKWFNT